MTEKFTKFYSEKKQHGIYSNWYIISFKNEAGVEFNCSEQYMMYKKALTFGDTSKAAEVMLVSHPGDQKQKGREVANFKKEPWDAISKDVVYKACYFKFEQNSKLKEELLATAGTTLVECAKNDAIWGIGYYADAPESDNRNTWGGTNWLGETLTRLREDFINNTIDFTIINNPNL